MGDEETAGSPADKLLPQSIEKDSCDGSFHVSTWRGCGTQVFVWSSTSFDVAVKAFLGVTNIYNQ